MKISVLFVILFVFCFCVPSGYSVSRGAGDSMIIDRIGLEAIRNIRSSLYEYDSLSFSTRIVVGETFCEISILPSKNDSKRWIQPYDRAITQSGVKTILSKYQVDFDLYVGICSPYTSGSIWYHIKNEMMPRRYSPQYYSPQYTRAEILRKHGTTAHYENCLHCGGGDIFTEYGKKSHTYGCRHTGKGRYRKTLSTTNTRKYPTIKPAKKSSGGGTVKVKGYYRKDGTYVKPHTRRKSKRK